MANLNCKYILEEPVSAALYRALSEKVFDLKEIKTWLIFDFGGGTLDVALVRVGNYVLETIAIAGDGHLGGQDLDHALMNYFIEEYIKEYVKEKGVEPKITPRLKAKFKQAACELKIALSGDQDANFGVFTPDFFVDGFTR